MIGKQSYLSFRGAPKARTRNPATGMVVVSGFRAQRFALSRNDSGECMR